jgi:hypothetical protein
MFLGSRARPVRRALYEDSFTLIYGSLSSTSEIRRFGRVIATD